MNKTVKWILIILGVLIVSLVAVKAMTSGDKEGLKVTAEKAAHRTIIETVDASGKVYPEVEVKISPDISGEITELTVAEGDSVKKGRYWPAFMPTSMLRKEMRLRQEWRNRKLRWLTARHLWKR